MTVMPIRTYRHLPFTTIHHPRAVTLFAFHNGFPIIRFIYAIVVQPAQTWLKNAPLVKILEFLLDRACR